MAVTFGGINTGLPPNLVDQLVEAEKAPIKNVEIRKAKTETKLKLVDDLSAKVRAMGDSLKDLANTRGFSDVKLVSGDPNIIAGTIDPGTAVNGSWNVEVIRLANKAGAITNGFPDKDKTQMGVGYFKFDTPEGTKEIYIDGNNSTLEAAAKKINNSGLGISASVINDRKDPENPYRLIISGMAIGADNQIQYPTLYFLDGDQDIYFDKENKAQNGVIKIDGFEMEIPDNTLTDIVPGATLELRGAAPGKNVNLTVKNDHEVVGGKIKGYVDSLNAVLGFIQAQNKLDEKTDTSQTLGGDGILRSIEGDIQRLVQDPQYGVSGSVNRLAQLGIQFNRNGTLTFDEEKFNSVLQKNPEDVRKFFVGDGLSVGLVPSTRRLVSRIVDSTFGPLGNRRNGLKQQIDQADKRISDMQSRLAQKEKSLRNQFANLETKMSQIKAQGAMLQQRLGGPAAENLNLNGASGGLGG